MRPRRQRNPAIRPRRNALAHFALQHLDRAWLHRPQRDLNPIPNNPTRKCFHPFDPVAYKQRNLIERMFARLKDFRRIATRYDKLARNFAAAVAIAAIVIWWV